MAIIFLGDSCCSKEIHRGAQEGQLNTAECALSRTEKPHRACEASPEPSSVPLRETPRVGPRHRTQTYTHESSQFGDDFERGAAGGTVRRSSRSQHTCTRITHITSSHHREKVKAEPAVFSCSMSLVSWLLPSRCVRGSFFFKHMRNKLQNRMCNVLCYSTVHVCFFTCFEQMYYYYYLSSKMFFKLPDLLVRMIFV